jgi:hypothetical protein
MEYRTEDYILKAERIDHVTKYYIRFLGQAPSPELEISEPVFLRYFGEFRKPLIKYENECRRHIDMRPISNIGENEAVIRCGMLSGVGTAFIRRRIMALISACPEKHKSGLTFCHLIDLLYGGK